MQLTREEVAYILAESQKRAGSMRPTEETPTPRISREEMEQGLAIAARRVWPEALAQATDGYWRELGEEREAPPPRQVGALESISRDGARGVYGLLGGIQRAASDLPMMMGFRDVGEAMRRGADRYGATQDALAIQPGEEQTTAGRVVGAVTGIVPDLLGVIGATAAAGPVGTAASIAALATARANDRYATLTRQGVDREEASRQAMITGTTVLVGYGVPVSLAGSTMYRVATGGGLNFAVDEAGRHASNLSFESSGYDRFHQSFDPVQAGVSVAMGGALGAVGGQRGGTGRGWRRAASVDRELDSMPAIEPAADTAPPPPLAAPYDHAASINWLTEQGRPPTAEPSWVDLATQEFSPRPRLEIPAVRSAIPDDLLGERPVPFQYTPAPAQPRADFGTPEIVPQPATSYRPIELLGPTPRPDAQIALPGGERAPYQPIQSPARRTTYDVFLDAQRKQAAGQVLSPFEAHLLRDPPPPPNAGARVEVPRRETPGDLFALRSYDEADLAALESARRQAEAAGDEAPTSLFHRRPGLELENPPTDVRRIQQGAVTRTRDAPMQRALPLGDPMAPRDVDTPLLPGIDSDAAVAARAGDLSPNTLRSTLEEVSEGMRLFRKDGQPLRKWLEDIFNDPDPVAAIRRIAGNGTHNQAELLDRWHRTLTGQSIEQAERAALQPPVEAPAQPARSQSPVPAPHAAPRTEVAPPPPQSSAVAPPAEGAGARAPTSPEARVGEQPLPPGVIAAARALKQAEDVAAGARTELRETQEKAPKSPKIPKLQEKVRHAEARATAIREQGARLLEQHEAAQRERSVSEAFVAPKPAPDARPAATALADLPTEPRARYKALRDRIGALVREGKLPVEELDDLPAQRILPSKARELIPAMERAVQLGETARAGDLNPAQVHARIEQAIADGHIASGRPRELVQKLREGTITADEKQLLRTYLATAARSAELRAETAPRTVELSLKRGFDEAHAELAPDTPTSLDAVSDLRGALREKFGRPVAVQAAKATDGNGAQRVIALKTAQILGRIFRRNVVLVKGIGGKPLPFDGAHFNGRIFIDVAAKDPVLQVLGHEVFHNIAVRNPEAAAAFRSALGKRVDDLTGDVQARHADAGARLEDAHEEVYADAFGEALRSPEFWARVAKESPNLVGTVAAWAMRYATRALRTFENVRVLEGLDNIKAVRDAAADAFVAHATHDHLEVSPQRVDFLIAHGQGLRAVEETTAAGVAELKIPRAVRSWIDGNFGKVAAVLPLRKMVRSFGDYMPPLRTFADAVFERQARIRQRLDEANNVVSHLREADNRDGLANVMLRSTVDQLFPNRPYAEQTWAHGSPDARARYDALTKAWSELSERDRGLYEEARTALSDSWLRVKDELKGQIARLEGIDDTRRANLARQLDEQFGRLQGPYFPLSRFGRYVLIAREKANPQNYTVEFFESVNERRKAADALRAEGLWAVGETVRNAEDYTRLIDGVSTKFVRELSEAIKGSGLDGEQRTMMLDTVMDLYVRTLPSQSGTRNFLRRKNGGIAGYSRDAFRSIANGLARGAYLEATLATRDKVQNAIIDGEARVRELRDDADASRAQHLLSEMRSRYDKLIRQEDTPLVDVATGAAYVYNLALSPAYMVLNALQTPMMTAPYLGARYGATAATKELANAARDAALRTNWNWDASATIDFDALARTPQEAEMLRAMGGLMTDTLTIELTSLREGHGKAREAFAKAISFGAHHVELFNRATSALAAYRLEMAKSNDHQRAVNAAETTLDETHFDYSRENKSSLLARPLIGRIGLQFQNYAFHMLYSLARNLRQAGWANDPETRSVALKTVAGQIGMAALMGGALTLPGMDQWLTVADALAWMFGDGDEPDARTWANAKLTDALGEPAARFVQRGAAGLLGADISQRLGYGSLVPLMRYDPTEGSWVEWGGRKLVDALGPAGGLGESAFKGLDLLAEGKYRKGVEALVPKAIRDVLKAERIDTEGVTNRAGETMIRADRVTATMLIAQAMGFNPIEVAEKMQEQRAVTAIERRMLERRSRLIWEFAEAQQSGNQRAAERAYDELVQFNQGHPLFAVRGRDVRSAVRRRANRQAMRDASSGLYVSPYRRDLLRLVRPSVDDDEE